MNKMCEDNLISIIVPVFNVELYLARCIESILCQTYSNFEVILVNDGSTDKSEQICKDYSEKYPFINYVSKKNGGLSSARNYGIELSKGDYLTFIDSDDSITPDYIETLMQLIYKYDVDMSICSYTIVRGDKCINLGNNFHEEVLDTEKCLSRMLLEQGYSVSSSAKMYKKELFDGIRYPDGKLYEDNGTTFKLILKCDKIAYSNKSIYNYYIRKNSITTNKFKSADLDYILMTDYACEIIQTMYPQLILECNFRKAYVYLTILKKMIGMNLTEEDVEHRNKIIIYLKKNYNQIMENKFVNTKIKLPLFLLNKSMILFNVGGKLYDFFR